MPIDSEGRNTANPAPALPDLEPFDWAELAQAWADAEPDRQASEAAHALDERLGEWARAYAVAALTLVQAERDAALVDAESWLQQADWRTADAVQFAAERDELRALLQAVWDDVSSIDTAACLSPEVGRRLKAALTPKATQQEKQA